jgi:multimeric flavodoxin WrbA
MTSYVSEVVSVIGTSYHGTIARMPRLLVVHHTPSPATQELLEAALAGARDDSIEGVEVVVRPALTASAVDALEADGYLLGTPANIGYISGALKHFFDTVYYPCLEATKGRPFAAYIHGNLGTEGAERAIEAITSGLQWRKVAATVIVTGSPTREDRGAVTELGGTVAATLLA